MWVKLGSEYLNLDHVVRVRLSRGWKNGQEEWVAEVESNLKGEVQVFSRYRGPEAEALRNALQMADHGRFADPSPGLSSPTTGTVHDLHLPELSVHAPPREKFSHSSSPAAQRTGS